MWYINLLPHDLRQDFYQRYLAKELTSIWCKVPCFSKLVDVKDETGNFIVRYCIRHGYLNILCHFLATENLIINVSDTSDGFTYAVHDAAANGHTAILKWLIAQGYKP